MTLPRFVETKRHRGGGVDLQIDSLLTALADPLAYLIIGFVAGLASIAPLGWFVPAQSVAVAGGALAGAGLLQLPTTFVAVFVGAYAGCAAGYALGGWFSRARPEWRPEGRLGRWWAFAIDMLRRRAGLAIMTGRWSAALRACVPNAAGISQVGWMRFMVWNALACAVWAAGVVGVGVAIQRALTGADLVLTVVSTLTIVLVAGVLLAGYRRWAAQLEASPPPADRTEGESA